MRSFILSQRRDLRTGEDFGVLVKAQAREFWVFWSLLSETVEDYNTVSCSSQV